MVKNLPDSVGDARDLDLIPRSGRSLGVENDNPLQCSCLENSMDREAWWVTVHVVAKSWTRLSEHTCMLYTLLSTCFSPLTIYLGKHSLSVHEDFYSFYICITPLCMWIYRCLFSRFL